MKKKILLLLFLPYTLYAQENGDIFKVENSTEYKEMSNQFKKQDANYQNCLSEWQETKVIGEFFNCVNPYILVKKIEDAGEKFISRQTDSNNNSYLRYTSSSIFPGSESVLVASGNEGVFSINFLISNSENPNEDMLNIKRQFSKIYGQPEAINDYTNSFENGELPYYFWELNDDVKLHIKRENKNSNNYIIHFYNKEELMKALQSGLLSSN